MLNILPTNHSRPVEGLYALKGTKIRPATQYTEFENTVRINTALKSPAWAMTSSRR